MGEDGAHFGGEIPFTPFDILGYIVPGALVLIAAVLTVGPIDSFVALGSYLAYIGTAAYVFLGVLLLLTYVLGHVTSAMGSFLLEKHGIRRLVPELEGIMLGEAAFPKGRARKYFLGYIRPYREPFVSGFRAVFIARFGQGHTPRERFLLCFHDIKEEMTRTSNRLDRFLQVYEFSRNLSLAFIVLAGSTLAKAYVARDPVWLVWTIVSLGFAAALFLRYARFFWRFTDEVFRSFYVLHLDGGATQSKRTAKHSEAHDD